MITFRFYVVSMTAMFLALALGVVIGSALDESIVEGLENRITTVDRRATAASEENDELRAEAERDDDVLAAAAPHMVDGSLTGTPVLVVAERGIDADGVHKVQDLVEASGATSPGVLWLEKGWALADEEARADLAERLDVTAAEPEVLRNRAWRLLADQLVASDVDPTTSTTAPATTAPATTTPSTPAPETTETGPTTTVAITTTAPPTTIAPSIDALGALVDAGLVTLESSTAEGPQLGDLLGAQVTVIVVTGPGSDLEVTGFTVDLVSTQVSVGVPTVLVAIAEEGSLAPAVESVLRDDALAERVSTVDNGHLDEGRAAAVLAAADLARSVVGHYGDLEGADRVVPVWTARSTE